MCRSSGFALSLTLVASLAAPVASAQSPPPPNRVALSAYESGIRAIKSQKWDDAITFLTRAAAADPVPRSYIQGTFRDTYFPQFFLFVACAKTNDMAKAQQYFNARGPVPQDVSRPYQSIIEDFDRKMADARRAAEQKVAVAEPPPPPAPEPARPIVTSPVQPSAPTEPRVGQAEAPKPPSQTPARRTAPADVSRISPGGAAPAKTTAAPPVETMPAPVVNATDRAAHDGLFALLTGDVERATMLLPRAIEETPATRTQRRAMLTAYLGVAYGNLSLSRTASRDENQTHARKCFADARALDASVDLAAPLVPPAVMRMFRQEKKVSGAGLTPLLVVIGMALPVGFAAARTRVLLRRVVASAAARSRSTAGC